jgi:hypothetical protein
MAAAQLHRRPHTQAIGASVSRRPAAITQADVARILRAAKQVGAKSAEVKVGEVSVVVSLDETRKDTMVKPTITF